VTARRAQFGVGEKLVFISANVPNMRKVRLYARLSGRHLERMSTLLDHIYVRRTSGCPVVNERPKQMAAN
jgi:hypothetical protein